MKKKILFLFSVAAALMLTLGAASCSTLSGDDQGTTPLSTNQNTGIWVTGVGKVTVTPDLAVLSLGVQAQAVTVADAQTQAAKAMSDVTAALKNNGVADKDIATTFYNITPVYSYDSQTGRQRLEGYSVTNSVTAKVRDISKAGTIIDAVASAGSDYTRINSVTLTVDEPEKYNEEAREAAMTDAYNRAKQLAKLGGVKLGKPTYVNESVSTPYRTIPFVSDIKAVPGAPTTPILPGEAEVTLTVQVVYNIS